MNQLLALLIFYCALLPVWAQPPEQPKFPTPPPPVTAENSVIGPNYADAPEAVANAAVPQGDVVIEAPGATRLFG